MGVLSAFFIVEDVHGEKDLFYHRYSCYHHLKLQGGGRCERSKLAEAFFYWTEPKVGYL